jgi:hypothetical protein
MRALSPLATHAIAASLGYDSSSATKTFARSDHLIIVTRMLLENVVAQYTPLLTRALGIRSGQN